VQVKRQGKEHSLNKLEGPGKNWANQGFGLMYVYLNYFYHIYMVESIKCTVAFISGILKVLSQVSLNSMKVSLKVLESVQIGFS
jgi:hypothetical protein